MESHREVVWRHRGSLCLVVAGLVVVGQLGAFGVVGDLLGLGGGYHVHAGAGASVTEETADPGQLTVVWTSNQNADALLVVVRGPVNGTGEAEPASATLDRVGERVRFEETGDTRRSQSVTVVVKTMGFDGYRERTRDDGDPWPKGSVIIEKEVEL